MFASQKNIFFFLAFFNTFYASKENKILLILVLENVN